MILDVLDKKNEPILVQFQKTLSIFFITKYLPHTCKHKQTILIQTLDEWNQIKDRFPDMVTIRTDTKLGQSLPEMRSRTCLKKDVPRYFEEARKIVKEPYFLCMELEEGAGERVDTKGGFHVHIDMGSDVFIRHVGTCFDYGDLIRRKAEHERWMLSWHDIPTMRSADIPNYHIQTISQKAYRASAIERMKFLINEYPNRKKEIIQKMPRTYKSVNEKYLKKLYKRILLPLYLQREDLLLDGLDRLDVEINILKNGSFVPTELGRPKVFQINSRIEEEISR